MLIHYVYTEEGESVFEESDVEGILGLPFGRDLQQLQNKILSLLGVTPVAEDKSKTEEE